jgi:BirA family biotin operon repressor/biotin-[acetyl-CoA-carboxylase] ligase
VIVAERQLKGRGRLGRSWQSDTPGNLYLSVAVALAEPLAQSCARLPLVAGLAAANAIMELAPSLRAPLRLKWPNDLLLCGKKVGGILCELVDRSSLAIVGLGLNLGPTIFKGSLTSTAATLSDSLNSPLLPEEAGAEFIAELENKLAFFQSMPMSCLVDSWTLKAEPFGRRVRVGALEGMTEGLDSQGRLLLRSAAGDLIPVVGGVVEETAS